MKDDQLHTDIRDLFGELAKRIAQGPQNEGTAAALRKLLEAKDCAVMATYPSGPEARWPSGPVLGENHFTVSSGSQVFHQVGDPVFATAEDAEIQGKSKDGLCR